MKINFLFTTTILSLAFLSCNKDNSKKYVSNIHQTSQNDPVSIDVRNDFSNVSWKRINEGTYVGTFESNDFDFSKASFTIDNRIVNAKAVFGPNNIGLNKLVIFTRFEGSDALDFSDGILDASIEMVLYD